ncbi:MAG: hypothetical protein FJX11_18665, partial [Alphaproteobacteria bacterium]|nr:hypothetical protein [Alphaproteobacteria bacterium]
MITDLEHRVFEQVGVVKAIYRYPVKSMGGERLGSAALRSSGIDGDRQYAFRRQNDASRFPWFTGRDLPPLVTYSARLLDTDNPRQAAARVSGPDGEWTIDDVELRYRLSDASGEPLQLLRVERGAFDNLPVSVLSTATLGMIEARHGRRLDERRFRANIVIESTVGGDAGRETNWVGGILTLGDRPHA